MLPQRFFFVFRRERGILSIFDEGDFDCVQDIYGRARYNESRFSAWKNSARRTYLYICLLGCAAASGVICYETLGLRCAHVYVIWICGRV